jgi:uncharacterized protein YndB with AHSA1/START domain
MAELVYDTLTVERRFPHSRKKVFAAFETREAQATWMCPAEGLSIKIADFDFRAGGRALFHMSMPDVGVWENEDRYQEILGGERIIQTSTLRQDGTLTFAGVVVILFEDDGKGCLVRVTEQGAFPAGPEEAAGHKEGWRLMLEGLGRYLGG